MDFAGGLREENGGLAGGISAADDDDLFLLAELRFHERCAVVDALAFELLQIGNARLVILRAGGDDDGAGGK